MSVSTARRVTSGRRTSSLSPFERDMLDPKVGARYRATILAQGGQEEEMAMVRKFLGREPGNKAFLDEITGKR